MCEREQERGKNRAIKWEREHARVWAANVPRSLVRRTNGLLWLYKACNELQDLPVSASTWQSYLVNLPLLVWVLTFQCHHLLPESLVLSYVAINNLPSETAGKRKKTNYIFHSNINQHNEDSIIYKQASYRSMAKNLSEIMLCCSRRECKSETTLLTSDFPFPFMAPVAPSWIDKHRKTVLFTDVRRWHYLSTNMN